jgi:tripartite-type tricarboxylate transporter receptor subunit TctC
VAEKLAALGVDPVATSPADFRQFVSAEIRKQAEAARIAGIEPE